MSRVLSRPPSAARFRRPRFLVAAGVAAMVAPLSVAAMPSDAARADPAGTTSAAMEPASWSAAEAAAAVAGEPQEVTLVTGDVVELTGSGAGGYSVEVTPTDRPGRTRFLTQAGPDGVYVLPSDAVPAIQAGWLDRELFNVSYLAEHGYADADSGDLPVIVAYREPAGGAARGFAPDAVDLARRADQLPGADEAVGLASINGAGVAVDKDDASEFWRRIHSVDGSPVSRTTGGSAPVRPAGDVAAVWLDGTAEVVLDESVPLIGAPQAWDAGYDGAGVTVAVLDTGVDLNHPDLAGQIAAAESFVDGLPPQDGHGHGTHVASTILGTGAASESRYVGVAPGAELVSGRVCNDRGDVCPFSSMIAGMEWAAEEMDADVVSISLSAGPTDGTDPVSQAVNSLTASTEALFVIAAGNNGRDMTVGSPGAADAALTVAATDKSDELAGFSSRGPRIGDMALKPDIAAPGVDIVAARAEGTTLGRPVNDWYTASNGTSMATPHVSGAAAILAQRFPDWGPEQMKAALMSTATDAGHTVYQQGAGRLDVGRAATQQVFATTTNVDYGLVTLPLDGQPQHAPINRDISYTNLSDQSVTLTLASGMTTTSGASVPAGALTTDPAVTVPAKGTATVTVTLDPVGLGEGTYTGAVVATDESTGVRLRTPVGLVREPPRFDLTIHTLGRDGQPYSPWAQDIVRLDGPGGRVPEVHETVEGTTVVRVPAGVYSIMQAADWVDGDSRLNSAMLLNPEVTVAGDTEMTLDLRQAEQITFTTPRPAEPLNNRRSSAYQRTTQRGETYGGVVEPWAPVGAWTRLWATPTDEVDTGAFRFWTQALLGKSEVDLTVTEPAGLTLHPTAPLHTEFYAPSGTGELNRLQDFHPDWVPFTGTQDLQLVDVGSGSPDELADLDVEGKLALMEATARFEGPTGGCGVDIVKIQHARDAGAAGIVVYPAADHPCGELPIPLPIVQQKSTGPLKDIGIPNVHISTQEGLALRDKLAAAPVTVQVEGTPETPYSYVLKPYEEGRVPDSLHYTFTDDDLAKVELDYHAPRPTTYSESRRVWKPDDVLRRSLTMAWGAASAFVGPRSRTEYFGPVSGEVIHTRTGRGRQGGLSVEGYYNRLQRQSNPQIFDQPEQTRQEWYVAPKTPGATMASDAVHELVDSGAGLGPCTFCRQAGYLMTSFRLVTGAPGNGQHDLAAGGAMFHAEESYGDFDVRLFREGTELEPVPNLPWDLFPMTEERAGYRLTADGPQTDVTWTFDSSEPVEDTRRGGYRCFPEMVLGVTDPCAPEPIVFVSYDMADSLAADNTVQAPGAQRFTVHAYHSPSTAPMPPIAGLKLWISYDGEEWERVRVRDAGDGVFEATAVHPPARRRASDQVTLRVEAWDEAGNRIEQITRDAYSLRDRGHGSS